MEEDTDQSSWSYLPDLIMEKVYSYLTISERYSASMVCKNWYNAFYLPYVWYNFNFGETTLTRRRFNYYSGWQHTLDHLRAQLCLATVGRNFRVLVLEPTTNFYNMYEFLNMLSYYAEQNDSSIHAIKGIGKNIKTLRYKFPCQVLSEQYPPTPQLYGTGGQLLAAIKRLMGNLKNLNRLELVDFMLANYEALNLLDDVCIECCTTLRYLSLVNMTKENCQLLHVGVFLNLEILVLSPQNLGEDALELLSHTNLKHLHLVQTKLTSCTAKPLSPKSWKALKKGNPFLNVHLTLETDSESDIIWQESAPVATVFFDSPFSKLDMAVLTQTLMWYKDKLKFFGHAGLPKFQQPKSFNERPDPFLLTLVKESLNLETLVRIWFQFSKPIFFKIIRERISTSTILLIAEHGRNLKDFKVRKNAVILKCDWPRNPSWDNNYYEWLKKSSKSYETTEKEVSKLIKRNWVMLSDKQFKEIQPSFF